MITDLNIEVSKQICKKYFSDKSNCFYEELHDGGKYLFIALCFSEHLSDDYYEKNKNIIIDLMDKECGFDNWMIVLKEADEVVYSYFSEMREI